MMQYVRKIFEPCFSPPNTSPTMEPEYNPVQVGLTAMSNSTAVALQNATTAQQNSMLVSNASMAICMLVATKAAQKAIE